jgi:glycosyltransferase involved in cell wall biosynthesis
VRTPRAVSIVVPVTGRRDQLAETLQSLFAQDDAAAFEVVVLVPESDAAACELALDFAARKPSLFRVERATQAGFAALLDRGMAAARGEIRGYLEPGETLLPQALREVACSVDAARGCSVVLGRSVYVDSGFEEIGIERPRDGLGHFEQLAVWRPGFTPLARSALFWHRSVLADCGGFRGSLPREVDYDFICRLTRRHQIHAADRLWSACRFEPTSAEATLSGVEELAMLLEVSRRYWGGALSPLRWRCEASRWLEARHLHDDARHHARRGEAAAARGQWIAAGMELVKTFALSPAMARGRWKRFRPWR